MPVLYHIARYAIIDMELVNKTHQLIQNSFHYLQDSDSQVDILHLPGTRCPAGGLRTSVDTAWHTTQIPGLVGILSHLKNSKIYHAPSKMLITGCADFLKLRHVAELIPVCTLGGCQGVYLWVNLLD